MFKKIIIELIELIYPITDLPPQVVFLFSILIIVMLFSGIIFLLFWPFKR